MAQTKGNSCCQMMQDEAFVHPEELKSVCTSDGKGACESLLERVQDVAPSHEDFAGIQTRLHGNSDGNSSVGPIRP
jgi:hypothetical protein